VSKDSKDITTLGRGGSDTTAVALAAALGADVCEIYTDVDGVYTADPRIVPSARRLSRLSHDEMLEMAASGAKVLQVRSVEYARNHGVRIHVRSSFSWQEGTVVDRYSGLERAIISGVAHDTGEGKLVIRGVPDRPGIAARIFSALAEHHVNVDMIVQNVSADGTTDISCTLPLGDGERALPLLQDIAEKIGATEVNFDKSITKISLIGAGMKTHPGIAAQMFQALSDEGVNIEMISTSTIRVSVVVPSDDTERAIQAIHTSFDLDAEQLASVEGR
jgi:aspartate kinase